MQTSIQIQLRASKLFALMVLAVGIGSVAVLLLLALAWWLTLLLITAIIGYLIYVLRQTVFLVNKSSIVALELSLEHGCQLLCHDQRWVPFEICGDSLRTGFLVVLNCRSKSKFNRACVIWRDSVSADDFSRLSLFLFAWR